MDEHEAAEALAAAFGQHAHGVRLDWGPVGAASLEAEVCVVVDVLSFSTTVTVAVERGTAVLPFAWRDERAAAYAAEQDAVLAVGRLEATRGDGPPAPSLSPAGLLSADPVPRLVLPSPNGSTIAAAATASGATVALGCLRNASAAGAWAAARLAEGRTVGVVAAGERWARDDSLRPALEDHLGAGAVLAAAVDAGAPAAALSPEAAAAVALWRSLRDDAADLVRRSAGGHELTVKGFAEDVEVAVALDASTAVPVLRDGAFQRAGAGSDPAPPLLR